MPRISNNIPQIKEVKSAGKMTKFDTVVSKKCIERTDEHYSRDPIRFAARNHSQSNPDGTIVQAELFAPPQNTDGCPKFLDEFFFRTNTCLVRSV